MAVSRIRPPSPIPCAGRQRTVSAERLRQQQAHQSGEHGQNTRGDHPDAQPGYGGAEKGGRPQQERHHADRLEPFPLLQRNRFVAAGRAWNIDPHVWRENGEYTRLDADFRRRRRKRRTRRGTRSREASGGGDRGAGETGHGNDGEVIGAFRTSTTRAEGAVGNLDLVIAVHTFGEKGHGAVHQGRRETS